jgi:hypothetical protein
MTRSDPLRTLALVAILAFVGCVGMAGCAADLTAPSDCANALEPPTFRLVLNTGDTLRRVTNHYLEPHTNSYRFVVDLPELGGTFSNRVTYAAGYCMTALDSAAWTTNHTSGVVP